jgi:hypothetical protein
VTRFNAPRYTPIKEDGKVVDSKGFTMGALRPCEELPERFHNLNRRPAGSDLLCARTMRRADCEGNADLSREAGRGILFQPGIRGFDREAKQLITPSKPARQCDDRAGDMRLRSAPDIARTGNFGAQYPSERLREPRRALR